MPKNTSPWQQECLRYEDELRQREQKKREMTPTFRDMQTLKRLCEAKKLTESQRSALKKLIWAYNYITD